MSFLIILTGVDFDSKLMPTGCRHEMSFLDQAEELIPCSNIAGRGATSPGVSGRCTGSPPVAFALLEFCREWSSVWHRPGPIHAVKAAFAASCHLQSSRQKSSTGRGPVLPPVTATVLTQPPGWSCEKLESAFATFSNIRTSGRWLDVTCSEIVAKIPFVSSHAPASTGPMTICVQYRPYS